MQVCMYVQLSEWYLPDFHYYVLSIALTSFPGFVLPFFESRNFSKPKSQWDIRKCQMRAEPLLEAVLTRRGSPTEIEIVIYELLSILCIWIVYSEFAEIELIWGKGSYNGVCRLLWCVELWEGKGGERRCVISAQTTQLYIQTRQQTPPYSNDKGLINIPSTNSVA